MNFDWTARQENLMAEFSEFGREQVAPRAAFCFANNAFDRGSWNALCATDFWRLLIPKEYGGLGTDWWDFTAAAEGLASTAADGGFVLSVISQAGFIRGLLLHGSSAQKTTYFPQILRGAISATCIAESHTGSHTPSVRTAATGAAGAWRLNGEKWNIAHAPTADLLLVVGRIPALGKRDISLFILDESHSGIERGPAQEKMGNRALPTSWLKFSDVPVSDADLLGAAGDGLRTLADVVALDRVYYGLLGSIVVRPAVQEAMAFLADRQAGKAQLLGQQHIQRKFADAAVALAQSAWLGRAALWQVLQAHPGAGLLSSAAKLTGADAFASVARDMVALMGSRGYLEGVGSRLLRDALGFAAVGGTEELHRIGIFKQFQSMDRWS